MSDVVSLDEQIREIEREIALRISVYKNRIEKGFMKKDAAEKHMQNIRAVLKTLFWLKDNETLIKAALEQK
jgi:hypothetical protein